MSPRAEISSKALPIPRCWVRTPIEMGTNCGVFLDGDFASGWVAHHYRRGAFHAREALRRGSITTTPTSEWSPRRR